MFARIRKHVVRDLLRATGGMVVVALPFAQEVFAQQPRPSSLRQPVPTISDIQVNPTEATATITWKTDRPATSRVDYGLTAGYELGFVEDPALVTSHSILLTGLTPSTLYHFRVTSVNAYGRSASSSDQTFTTGASALTIFNLRFNAGVTSLCVTSLSSPPATSRVDYGLTTGYELGFVEDSTLVTSHSITIPNLTPSTTYQFLVSSEDALARVTDSGN